MMKTNMLYLLLLFIITTGCDSNNDMESENIDFDIISKSSLAGAGDEGIEKQNLVITDSQTWENLIHKMNTVNNTSQFFTETDIDFSENIIIAVFSCVKSSGGFSLDLNLASNQQEITVRVTELTPGIDVNATTVITQPYYIVKIPFTNLPIVFSDNKSESGCISPPKTALSNELDLDNDSITDFELVTYEIETHDVPSSAGTKYMAIKPTNDNKLLYKDGTGYLFLVEGDSISSNPNAEQQWSNYNAELLLLGRSFENYDDFWTVNSDLTDNFYLGIKLLNSTEEKLGWLKLEFDTSTGEIFLMDSEISIANELVVSE